MGWILNLRGRDRGLNEEVEQKTIQGLLSRRSFLKAAGVAGMGIAIAPGLFASPASARTDAGPEVGAGTSFLDHNALLAGMDEPEWYEANIPFVEVPDQEIQNVYYYRWRVHKEALKYTTPESGWIVTEFLGPIGYAAPYGGISAAAGHHIYEGRWVRDQRYLDDYINYWLRGPGSGPKPKEDFVNKNTSDWAHEYSFWVADAVYQRAAVTGDWDFARNLLPELERQWEGWGPQYNEDLGLYWQTPVWDAMELTASSYQSDDPYHGGDGFRPTINAYQYGDAVAIARIARMEGNPATAKRYEARARGLKAAMNQRLWDTGDRFYKHMMRDNNPQRELLKDREEIGFVPWYFHMAEPEYAVAWKQVMDPQGFFAPFGPTTAERRSPWFMHEAEQGCCRWDGPSWPYATSQTLTAFANLLIDYPEQDAVSKDDYYTVLRNYALTQYKNGRPYVAEAHHPDENRWMYDSYNHSEDYNHSTFNDLVLSGLLGVRPQAGKSIELSPLVPDDWDYFALENLPYHGRNVTVLWDRDGARYGKGDGLRVYLDGQEVAHSPELKPLRVKIGGKKPGLGPQRQVNDATNVDGKGFPKAFASYSWRDDPPQEAIDGQNFYLDRPSTRWTTYQSPNAKDHLGVDFGVPTPVSDLRIFTYDDGGGVRTPADLAVQYWTGQEWADVEGARYEPAKPVGNAMNRVTLPTVETSKVRVVFTPRSGASVGVTEMQSWSMSSADARLIVEVAGEGDTVKAGQTTKVTTTFSTTTGKAAQDVKVELVVPDGWQVRASSPSTAPAVASKHELVTTWEVTPPKDLEPGNVWPLVARAGFRQGSRRSRTQGRTTVSVAFDPADYPRVRIDDGFDTDTSSAYTPRQPFANEAIPRISAGGGRLTASDDQRFFTLLDSGKSPGSPSSVVIVDPAKFIGDAPAEDSLFVGLVKDNDDYICAWYNNHYGSSGFDVRVNGRFLDAGGSGAATLAPGDRFALQIAGNTIRSWSLHDGEWREIRSIEIPGVDLSDDATRVEYHFMFGLRGDPGTMAVDRFEARGR